MTPRAILRTAVWVFLFTLGGCTAAQLERGEDDVCSFIARELPNLPAGRVKDGATLTKLACDAEEALEKQRDSGP